MQSRLAWVQGNQNDEFKLKNIFKENFNSMQAIWEKLKSDKTS